MDILSWLLARKYTDNSILGIAGALAGKNCTIESAQKVGSDTTIVFKWTADNGTVRRTSIVVTDGDTPAISSTPIAHGHKLTFTTSNPTQSVTFDVLNGNDGAQGVSVVGADVDNNNYLKLTLSNGNVISAGQIKAVTNVDPTLSPTSSNPVENKVITAALDTKVDKEAGKGLFSDEEKAKLANIEDGAQVNVLEKLIINGQEATITDKSIALTIITSAVSNLQNYYLKTETYTKQEVEDLIGSTVGVTIEIVEQLPTEGQSNVIYFLPTESEGVYSQYIYTTDGWILIGSTTVDLSNYYTKAQVDALLNGKQNVLTIDSFPTPLSNNPVASGGVYTAIAQMQPQFQFANMPTASASNLGFVYQYTGATGTYTQNMFYRCVYDDVLGEYKWVEVIFHATVTVDSAISGTSTNPVQNKVIKEALDTKQGVLTFDETPTALSPNPVKSGGMYTALQGKNDKFQYDELPIASVDLLGKIYQYTGATTATLKNGYFYKCVLNEDTATYEWSEQASGDSNVQADWEETDTSSDSYIQNKPTLGTASEKDVTDVIRPNNHDVAESGSTYNAIIGAVASVYEPRVPITVAELTSALLIADNIGTVYKATTSGTTTADFLQGADIPIEIGDCIGVLKVGATDIKFNLMGQTMDLHDLQPKQLATPLTIDGQEQTSVEGALGALNRQTNFADNPIGTILPYGGSTVPTGWLLCDGSAVSRTTYSDLFGVIGTAFGTGNGSTTFNIPDMRESVPKGAGLTGHSSVHYDTDGVALGEFIEDRIQNHIHRFSSDNSNVGTANCAREGGAVSQNRITPDSEVINARSGATTEVKSVGVNYIIKAKMIGVPADFLAKVDEAVGYVYQTSDVEGEYDANDFAVVGKTTRYCAKSPVHGYQVDGTAWWGFYETVCFRDGGYGYQTFRTMLGIPAMAIRQLYNGSWGDWKKLITESDLTSSVTDGSTAPITSGGVYDALPKQRKTGGTGADFNTVMSELGLSGYPNKFAFEVFGSNANPCWAKGMVYRASNSASCKMYYDSSGCTMASNVGGAIAVYSSDQSTPYSDATIVFTRIS